VCSRGWTTRGVRIGAFSALTLAVLVSAVFYYRAAREQARTSGYRELAAVSRLKAGQIEQWRSERLSDAVVAAGSPFLARSVQAWLESPANHPGLQADLKAWLTIYMIVDPYAEALLLDGQGHVLLSARASPESVGEETLKALTRAASNRQAVLSDLYQDAAGNFLCDALAPIIGTGNGAPKAFIDLRIDAGKNLFPLVQSWPTPSRSAETLLIRRDGENVLFLSGLRHGNHAAMSLLLPISLADAPAVQAVNGKRGMFEGQDYRGVKVIADLRPVKASPWFLVSKVDAAEVYREANYRTFLTFLVAVLLVLLAGAGTSLSLRQRQAKLYRDLLEAERKERETEREYRTALYSIGDAVIGTDTKGAVWHMNPEAERLTGWKESEARGETLETVFRIVNEGTHERVECPVDRALREGTVVGLANHTLLINRDGTERPIADSGSPIRGDDGELRGVILVFRDQTEERAAQSRLEASEERYRSLVENIEVGIAVSDPGEVFTFANLAAERIFSVARGSLPGRSLREFLTDSEYARVRDQTARRAKGERSTYDLTITRPDGKERHLQVTGIPQVGPRGEFDGTFGTMQDVTEKDVAEADLARERGLMQTLMDSIPEFIYFKDLRGRFILVNKAHAEHLGARNPSEAAGKTDFDFYSARHAEAAFEDEQEVISTGQPILDIEERETWPDRPDSWVSTTKMPLRNEKGETIGTFGISRDITGRRKMEASLRESEEHYRNTFMNAPFGIFHSTADGKLVSANSAHARMLGYESPEEMIEAVNRKSIADVLYADPKRRAEVVGELLARGGWQAFPNTYRTKDGKIIDAILTMRLYSRSGASQVELEGFVEDVTERARAEEERKKLQEQLLQAQKMEAVGRLAGGIAHDFNNILTAIYGYCGLGLEHSMRGDQRLRSFFLQIQESASRAANLTSQLLAFSRRRIFQLRTVNLGDLASGMIDMLRRLLGEDIDVHAHRGQDLWNVQADPSQIEQVIMNLAVNSRDAMPGGGVLTIETANVSLDESYALQHTEIKAGQYVVLAVSDTGHGMDAATLDRIYEPFFTTKEPGKGTGLGLATVYGIVRQSGGNIYCYSEPGKGTTFKIYLPRWEGEQESVACPASRAVTTMLTEATILFVDDDEAVRTIAVTILRSAGYTVTAARNGKEALAALASLSSPLDMLVTDVVMPGMNGMEVASHVRQRFASVRVLYVSGYTEDAVVHHGILEEGVQLLQKPFTATDLLQRVRNLLDPRPPGGA
jgi:PAS domain S-box-containing protein